MRNLILHRTAGVFTATFLLITINSVSFTSPAKRSSNKSAQNIEIELSSNPNLPISAATEFPIYTGNGTALITVKVTANGTESSDLRKDVTLGILGLQDGQGYVPVGQGYLHPIDGWPNDSRWVYGAFKEPPSEKHPQIKNVVIGAKYKGRAVGEPIKISIYPVFNWLTKITHQHGPSAEPHSPTDDDFNNAWRYARWKYGISTGNLNSIAYDKNLAEIAYTTFHLHFPPSETIDTLLGMGAFTSENFCASTLGHEDVHGSQPASLSKPKREYPAYYWEVYYKDATGLSLSETQDVTNCQNYYADPPVPGASCAGTK